ncbi:MAG: tryptophan synthase beta chain [Gammaproteobacteria bacterium]|jgi:tryptophan synthase beta chain
MQTEIPDRPGYFGEFGGCFAPEILMQYMLELERVYSSCRLDAAFQSEFNDLLHKHAGRQTPLYLAEHLSRHAGGASIYLKREDLTATGSHHINAALGQTLLAKKMGKTILVTDTATGLHGLAVARAAALMELECHVFIGTRDRDRQVDCVEKIEALGAKVTTIESGRGSRLEANEETTRFWLGSLQDCFYVVNSVIGPHPYPLMVRDFQSVIGDEVKEQIVSVTGNTPDHLVACVGAGSNAIGLFYAFLDTDVPMTGVQAAGDSTGLDANVKLDRMGVFQGVRTSIRQDKNGQILNNESLAVGLQTCMRGPELCFLQSTGRLAIASATDSEALAAYHLIYELESISVALESAHAIAWGLALAASLDADKNIVINLSGKGEKDASQVAGDPQ